MWQLCISVDKDSDKCLDYIRKKAHLVLKKNSAVVLKDYHGDRPRLSIGCDTQNFDEIRNEIKSLIADCIVDHYKYKFIASYINIPIIEPNRAKAFLQALVAFDREYEHGFVVDKLAFDEYIAIDGYLNFRLKDLKLRWKDVCGLASFGGKFILDYETYIDMLSFLVSNIDSKVDEVTISKEDATSKYVLTAKSDSKQVEIIKADPDELLAKIIDCSPKTVSIAGACELDSANINILRRLYDIALN